MFLPDIRPSPEDKVEVTDNIFKNIFWKTFEGFWLL
jgi:hypothetical protein